MINRLAAALLLAAPASAWSQDQPKTLPYLPAGSIDIIPVLTPAPVPGDARDTADRAIFKSTRTLVGTPRYAMATSDVDYSLPAIMRDFSCAAGVALSPSTAPKLTQLLGRASLDTSREAARAKNIFKRARPFLVDAGPTCQAAADLKGSYDYPSGHATLGWTWGTILAELVPARATPILARARAFGDSRIVCGVHNESAVEGGREAATAVLSVVRGAADYQADLAAARAELAALRQSSAAPDAAACSVEAALVAERDY